MRPRDRKREDAEGELYAPLTNIGANGTGGIVYQLVAVPAPATWASLGIGVPAALAKSSSANSAQLRHAA